LTDETFNVAQDTNKPEVPLLPADAIRAWLRTSDQTLHIGDLTLTNDEAKRVVLDLLQWLPPLAELAAFSAGKLRAPAQAQGWQPIETAPESERVHVYVPNAGVKIAQKTTHPSDGPLWWDGEEIISKPTHWMPLPEAPK
jgi:hypothetical protein